MLGASYNTLFCVRYLGYDTGFVVEAAWPNGYFELISGIYPSAEAAARWVNEEGVVWVRRRLGMTLH